MANQESNHIYFVDPGIGEKTEGCPYSNYADGRDVDMFIIPPMGYVLTGFKFEPYNTTDQFYDGKIVAQYEKKGFFYILKQNFLKYLAAIVIITLVSLIAVTIANQNKFQNEQRAQLDSPEIEITATPTAVEEEIVQEEPLKEIIEEEPVMQETVMEEEIAQEEIPQEAVAQETVMQEEIPQETVIQEAAVKEEEPIKEEIVEEKPKEEVSETSETQPTAAEVKAQFKNEFWNLIHHKEKRMSQYGQLYRKYKGKVKGSEFNYLWLTILESTSDFKVWSRKLDQVPADEIKKVRTITQLTNKIEEYN